jgi:DDE superfamily endonuclease
MSAMNSNVVIDHDGLIIFVDPGYPGSFHDVAILRNSELHANWPDYFTHTDETIEYVLGDPGYSGSDMFIMRELAFMRFLLDQVVGQFMPATRCTQGVEFKWNGESAG